MICPNCNTPVSDSASFCPECGTRLSPATADAAPTSQQPYQQPAQPQTQVILNGQPYQQQTYQQQTYQQQGIPTAHAPATKSRVAAGLLGIFLGSLGIHKFYLGYSKPGVIMLLVTLLGSLVTFGLAAAVMSVIGIIEGVMYLTKSDEEFYYTYELTTKEWF